MRWLAFLVLTCCACSSDPAAAPADAATPNDGGGEVATDAGADTPAANCSPPTTANALVGELSGGSNAIPAWSPKSVHLIQRAKDPAHPQIMFFSALVECSALANEDFKGTIPASNILALELGKGAVGSYLAAEPSPPAATGAYIYETGSYTPPNPPPPDQYSDTGMVTVDTYDTTGAKGTFFAEFVTSPPKTALVCGRFDAKPCAVNW